MTATRRPPARAGPPEREGRPGARHSAEAAIKKAPASKPATQRLVSPAEPHKTDLPGLIIWPHHADEALARIPRNETAARIVLTFAGALGVAIRACDDRIEITGLQGLPDNLRKPISLHLVCLCRSIWPLLTGEAVQ